jgi:toxin ParE1/3/4
MAEIVWTEPALAELDAIADYIALDNPSAASRLVQRIFSSVEQLGPFPKSGSRVPEIPRSTYRQLVIKPCRVFYRHEGDRVYIVFVMRSERLFRKVFLAESGR